MNRILVITDSYPEPDKASGDLRLFTLLAMLARHHEVLLCATDQHGTHEARDTAKQRLSGAGVQLHDNSTVLEALRDFRPELVWFEFFHQFRDDYSRLIHRYCPEARIVVDSVDVHFNRLEARARLTESPDDAVKAQEVKTRELSAYEKADMIFAVSQDDKALLLRELPNANIEVLPNVHAIPTFPNPGKRRFGELIFVGGFRHDPNIDAVKFFCREVLPIIIDTEPRVRLKVIGSAAPADILALTNEHVEVLGYVPETGPHLEGAYISIAPLRYGGGMKGKVGEAMSFGLPVVTTSFGAEGFGLSPNKDLLIGDTPEAFAAQVIALLTDAELHARISQNGYRFIAEHYSVEAVEGMLESSVLKLNDLRPRKLRLTQRFRVLTSGFIAKHVSWRIQQR